MIPKRYHLGVEKMVRDVGLEPTNLSVLGPKPSAFANFASRARGYDYNITFPSRRINPGRQKNSTTDESSGMFMVGEVTRQWFCRILPGSSAVMTFEEDFRGVCIRVGG